MENPDFSIEYEALGHLADLTAEQFGIEFANPRSINASKAMDKDGLDASLQADIELGLIKLYQTKKLEQLYKDASQYVPKDGRTIVTFQFFPASIIVGVLDAETQTKLYATTMESYR